MGDPERARQVILGKYRLVDGAAAGKMIVDSSTISPSASKTTAADLKTKGIVFLVTLGTRFEGERRRQYADIHDRQIEEGVRSGAAAVRGEGKAALLLRQVGLYAKLPQIMILGNLLQAIKESMVLSTKANVDPEMRLKILITAPRALDNLGKDADGVSARLCGARRWEKRGAK